MPNTTRWLTVATLILLTASVTQPVYAECVECKSCPELIRMAQNYQQDIKTVDIVLGSAIDAGSLQMIRSYKLTKGTMKRQLESVMREIEHKGCVAKR
ncbi:MAG: hypothetical protein FJ118_08020 [Deltaproteobacteria bacterium]|nr:hypothetical protein [Deltaproteobacteria bacterium]